MADRPLDRRQVLRALLLAGAGIGVPAACGVPTGGRPIIDGPGPSAGPVGGGSGRAPKPGDATSATNLVELFLSAASGQLNTTDLLNAAQQRVRGFLTKKASDQWKPTPPDLVTVVRVEGLTHSFSGSTTIVAGTLQPVGTLTHDGTVAPYSGNTAAVQVKFTVSPADEGAGLRISELPPALPNGLLLATDALDGSYFTPQMIYFWDNAKQALVPDLRYVPTADVKDSVQLETIVNWLIAGPSDLISSVGAPGFFPTGTQLSVPSVVIKGDRVVVNFNAALQPPGGPNLGKVMAQLQWSLQPLHPLTSGPVELQILTRPQQVAGAADLYKSVNPAEVVRSADPQPFCVTGNVVEPQDGPLPAVLSRPEYNQNVLMAALSRDKVHAALVSTGHRLSLLKVDDTERNVSFVQVDLKGTVWSRPAWLPSGRRLLVVVDGRLLLVTAAGAVSPVAPDVTAFAVAPDGYRIALVRQSGLAVGTLSGDSDQLSLSGTPRSLDAGLSDLSGVAWSRLDRLVVAGRLGSDQWRLAELTIDGAIRSVWNNSFSVKIVSVVAYPRLPSQSTLPGAVMVQTQDNAAFRVFLSSTSQPDQVTARDPSPSPASSGPAKSRPAPTAPFYPD